MSSALAVVRLVSACMRRLQDPLRPGNRSCTLKDGRRPFEAFSLTRCLLAQRLGLLLLPIDSVLVARSSDNKRGCHSLRNAKPVGRDGVPRHEEPVQVDEL